ncbi:hypothetical protein DTI93_05630 [Parasaccharibacter sp. TMW 2.1884]|nr:hypothetical protein [Parasaccharibacter sp. TMW 2.1884]
MPIIILIFLEMACSPYATFIPQFLRLLRVFHIIELTFMGNDLGISYYLFVAFIFFLPCLINIPLSDLPLTAFIFSLDG